MSPSVSMIYLLCSSLTEDNLLDNVSKNYIHHVDTYVHITFVVECRSSP